MTRQGAQRDLNDLDGAANAMIRLIARILSTTISRRLGSSSFGEGDSGSRAREIEEYIKCGLPGPEYLATRLPDQVEILLNEPSKPEIAKRFRDSA